MTTLVIAVEKISSYAVAWEKCNELQKNGKIPVLFILDPVKSFYRRRYVIDSELSSKFNILPFYNSVIKLWRHYSTSSKLAKIWLKSALISSDWENVSLHGYPELPISRAMQSLLARSMGTKDFKLSECNRNAVLGIATDLLYSYFSIFDFVSTYKVTASVVFGGRSPYSAGALIALKNKKIHCQITEISGAKGKWVTYKISPHFPPENWDYMLNLNTNGIAVGTQSWWEEKILGIDHLSQKNWGSTREKGLIPYLPSKYLVFFSTSEFELPILTDFDYNTGKFKNQFIAAKTLVEFSEKEGIRVIIRRHPNSVDDRGIDQEWYKWKDLADHPNVIYISPFDKYDSIDLALKSHAVFTYKSSIGVECLWLEKSSYAMGPAKWAYVEELRVWDAEKLEKVFQNNFKQVNKKSHAIKFSNLMINMGNAYEIFQFVDANKAEYNFKLISSDSIFYSYLRRLIRISLRIA